MRGRKTGVTLFMSAVLSLFIVCAMLWANRPAFADEKKKDLPARAIYVAPEYSGVVVPQGDDVDVSLTVKDKGRRDEDIELTVPQVPKGWDAKIKSYNHIVTGVYMESDSTKSLTFKAVPDKSVGPGKYTFVIKGETRDGELTSSSRLNVTVKEKEKVVTSKDVIITTSYPVLQGPTDAKFEFSLDVENKTDKDATFNLAYEAPENWEIRFKPAYEDKYFSSLRIKSGQSQTVAVEVKPYLLAEPGKYPIKVKVASPEAKGEADLNVVLTGTHKLEVATVDGLLSLNAFRGKPANLSFYVKNTGSATQSNVSLMSFKPENWKVKFTPEKIETLAPGELKQVEVTVTPAEEALVGDYSVGMSVKGEKVSKDLELRVTVKASTAWGGIGIGIIVLVLAGLVVLFTRFGRR
jgi:uncharacterized membrane protein